MIKIECADMLQELKQIPENSIDCLVTDPPYKIVSGGCTKPLGKNPMPGHLSELHPVNEANTKGQ